MSEMMCPVCGDQLASLTQPCPSCGNLASLSSAAAIPIEHETASFSLEMREESATDAPERKSSLLWRISQYIVLGVFIIFALIAAYKFYGFLFELHDFLFGGGIIRRTFGKFTWSVIWGIMGSFAWMLKKVFLATFISLLPPIIVYCIVNSITKNVFASKIANALARLIAGVGSIYIFYLLSGPVTFSLAGVLGLIKLAFQIYFLCILVLPSECMMILGAVASVIGSIIIGIFPDLPGTIDDTGAICTLITMVFVYMNMLALLIKRFTAKIF
jgi:hypothetical protein